MDVVVIASPPDWQGVRRLVVLEPTDDDSQGLLEEAARRRIETTAVAPADDDVLLRRLVDVVGDGRDAVLVPSRRPGAAAVARVAARRTGAGLWEPVPGDSGVVATEADALPDDTLEHLHAEDSDPWGAESRWYERRKRALVLAALPRDRFADALELGSSTGVLAEALAERCDRLLAVDRSPTALDVARRRLGAIPGAAVAELDVPRQWPAGRSFDLVVVSEVGYFLSPAALDRLVERIEDSLRDDGVVVLCHWRHPVEGWVMDAEAVHRGFAVDGLPPLQATYRDRDVELRMLARDEEWPDPAS